LRSPTNELGQDQRETAVAVSPNDPLNIVAANIDKPYVTFSFSADGGLTWSFGGALPRDTDSASATDPAVAADADGNFYVAYTDSDTAFVRPEIAVARSSDGGRTSPAFSVVTTATTSRQNRTASAE
jgi:hypothetical protein